MLNSFLAVMFLSL